MKIDFESTILARFEELAAVIRSIHKIQQHPWSMYAQFCPKYLLILTPQSRNSIIWLTLIKGLSHWKPDYIESRWADTVIAALGNATYSKMKSEASRLKTMSSKQLLVKQMVEKKRKLFFQDKQKQKNQEVPAPIKQKSDNTNKNNDVRAKREDVNSKKREEALKKKPAQPYMF